MSSTVDSAVDRPLGPAASRALGEQLGDPEWLASLRAKAADVADALDLPTPQQRPWKYLDLGGANFDPFRPAQDAARRYSLAEAREAFAIPEAASAVAVENNSEVVLAENPTAGVQVSSLRDAGKAAERMGEAVPHDRNKLTALHYAFLRDAVVVTTDRDVEVVEPVRIVREYADGRQLGTPHTLIVTGANSHLTVVEDLRSSDEPMLILPAAEILPGPGSQVTYVVLHRWGRETRVLGEQQMVSERDSAFVSFHGVLGGRTVKEHLVGSLEGRGSSSELYGVTLGGGKTHTDFYTIQDHIGPDTRSDLMIKAALYDEARAVYYGLTKVGLGAKNADANQENRNLLLSRKAMADSDPVLEILTSNVIKVSHGATAGPVDEEQLFYLQSRGIPRKDAEALLVRGFLGEVIARLPGEALREELSDAVEQVLVRIE